MSLEAVTGFIKQVGEDAALYASIKKLEGRDFPSLLRIAENAGYSFSADEWKSVALKLSGDLSDEDLDQVTGGALPMTGLNGLNLKLTVSPVLQNFMKPMNPLGHCASCTGSGWGTDGKL